MDTFYYDKGKNGAQVYLAAEFEKHYLDKVVGSGSYQFLDFVLLDDGRMIVKAARQHRYTKQWYKEVMKKIEETA